MMKRALKELRKGKRWSRYFLGIFALVLALFCLLLKESPLNRLCYGEGGDPFFHGAGG